MSNTEVKVLNAESSWWETACEGRTLPCGHSGLAQLVEHLICNQRVACSSHVAGIKSERSSVVEHHLAKVGVAGSNPVVRLERPGWRNWQTHRT